MDPLTREVTLQRMDVMEDSDVSTVNWLMQKDDDVGSEGDDESLDQRSDAALLDSVCCQQCGMATTVLQRRGPPRLPCCRFGPSLNCPS